MSDVTITISAVDRATAELRSVAREVDRLSDHVTRGGGAFRALEEIAVGALRQIGAGALSLATSAVAGLIDQITASIGVAGQFEAALNRFGAVAGTSLQDVGLSLEDVQQKALALGQTTQFSASQALAAMTELVKGGVSVDVVMEEATAATLNLAAAAGIDLAHAAEIVAKQLGVWGATGVTASQAADLLAAAANASTVDVHELALGLANVGGTARTAGLSFEETVQTMALIAPLFSSAADAGTSLKTFLARLIPTTKDATETMIQLGLATEDGKSKFFDAEGQFIGMEATSRLLAEAMAGLSEEQKLLALNTIFGSDAIRAASAIAEAGAAGYVAMGEAMAATGGAAAAAAAQQQGYQYALDQVNAAVETLQVTIGSALLPAMTDAALRTADTVNAVTAFATTVLNADDPLYALADAVGVSRNTIDALGDTVRGVVDGIVGAWDQIDQIVVPATTQAWSAILATVQAIGAALMELIGAVVQVIMRVWAEHGEHILATTATVWESLMQAVAAGAELIQAIISLLVDIVTAIWSEWGDELLAILAVAWDAIGAVIDTALDTITGVFRTITALLSGDWEGAWEEAKGVVARVWEGIKGAVEAGKDGVMTVIANLWPSIQSAWNDMIGNAASLGSALMNGITSGVTRAARDLASSVARAAQDALNAAKSALGISSPSRLAAQRIGEPLGEGVLVGLARSLHEMPDILRAAVAAPTPAQAQVSVAVGGITVQAAPGMDERRLAVLVREEVDNIVRTARLGRF